MTSLNRVVPITLLFALLLIASCQGPLSDTPESLSPSAGWQGADPKSADAFTFVVVSDRTGGHAEGEWAAAVEQINLLQPDFVISVGDLIEGYSEDEGELTRQWEEFDSLTRQFDAPFFYCPGNHDVSNDLMREMYCQRHGVKGKSYYSFDYRGCHFVVLDSNTAMRKAEFADEQFAWIAKDLASAKDASRIFIFFHHPKLEGTPLWPRLRELIPVERTTVFNGHWHQLSDETEEGLSSYVLASTATRIGPGEFRMFAQVTVDQDQTTVAIVPMHQVLPVSYAQFTKEVRAIFQARSAMPEHGGPFVFQQNNPLEVPLTVEFNWEAPHWTIEPPIGRLQIAPGAATEIEFSFTPRTAPADHPILRATYSFQDSYRQQFVKVERELVLATYSQLEIPRLDEVTVDGSSEEFVDVQPLRIIQGTRIFSGRHNWSDPADSSFDMRVASDGERLFIAVDVTDDQIQLDGLDPWDNDAVEIFWDARPPEKRDGHHGPDTGQLILVVPEEDAEPQARWYRTHSIPEGLVAACKRRDGGYTYELSIPLTEFGASVPPTVGQNIWLVVMLDDRDHSNGRAGVSHMTTTGLGQNHESTGGYPPWTFK